MRRINQLWKLYLFYTGVLMVTMTAAGFVIQGHLRKSLVDHLAADVLLLTKAMEINIPRTMETRALDHLSEEFERRTGVRVTIIRKDGTVIAESSAASVDTPNHLQRPEVQDALREGVGRAIRPSRTLGIDMLYVATWVRDRELVLRPAMPLARVKAIENQVMTFMVIVLYLTPILSALIAFFFARRIVVDGRGPAGGSRGQNIGA
jgi:two-component system, OmpR family, phosphate regulon sensor histidine kinase PhoR